MPELPEVQTIVSDLNQKIVGYTIVDFWSDWPKAIKNLSLEKFKKEIRNRKILNVRRIGKNIFIDLSNNKTLYIHLKMTGHLLVKPAITKKPASTRGDVRLSTRGGQETKTKNYFDDKVNGYIHHIWKLETKKLKPEKLNVEFSDVRKFAKIVLDDTKKINTLPEIKKLGIDVMDKKFTLKKFEEILEKRKNRAVGLVLMEQELMSGIGNIYRSEILHLANILPQRKIEYLSGQERIKLYRAIFIVLKKAIKMRGTSDSDYRDTFGAPGNFQKVLKVYRKTGKKCSKCATIIKKSTLGQRSIFYCSQCQH
ncbi:MAG TPA: bifunctional DNA-formamidopyrimidine glycosylase/DNA-(apurinic or apyrimidinic site) lyase [Candidatus Moranbacteria bacterium]|nr:bifunctional DNA-formamidopyrimidine glycosylase/DNA-(apurinic or apyrimidinic site) lyase [Candidatus Moranbacteria bacterium]HRY27640.1 bifunctional DNA-formamidopyrimidine glycosylase/DNA-(apurinic or apyrimidinic site) lyase [Candidatus Moranbacteria bacterium]HSA08627.1 bifunctional DNA-formamidopyrimidine glycosylase/DNA-(apurinic or apyrimidinic site) lyase [Candidatus Moranbacteria bacterium]